MAFQVKCAVENVLRSYFGMYIKSEITTRRASSFDSTQGYVTSHMLVNFMLHQPIFLITGVLNDITYLHIYVD